MKTNKLPLSAWSDSQAAGSHSQQINPSNTAHRNIDDGRRNHNASNDASYHAENWNETYLNHLAKDRSLQDGYFGYKCIDNRLAQAKEFAMSEDASVKKKESNNSTSEDFESANGYKKVQTSSVVAALISGDQTAHSQDKSESHAESTNDLSSTTTTPYRAIPERIFMNGLIKHTGIALAIIIPLAAFSAYAASPPATPPSAAATNDKTTNDKTKMEALSVKPSSIIHKSANTPTTVDSVDLKKYAGTWYEIGRLPMYFQRNCASDVTATYTEKTDGSGIKVINQCKAEDGSGITAEGLAKPADATGSKLKVTFLPSWIRWLPVGRADYWVLARDPDYKTALVGTPDKKYLWLLARSPNVSQETYAKYRQIAQQQGYDLKEFKLTPQTKQTVNLVP